MATSSWKRVFGRRAGAGAANVFAYHGGVHDKRTVSENRTTQEVSVKQRYDLCARSYTVGAVFRRRNRLCS